MKRLYYAAALLLAIVLAMPQYGYSIPAFARKYGFNCNMCHTSFTKLNDFGQRYRMNGYQMPGQEGTEQNVFQTAPPLALRTTTGMSFSHTKTGNTSGFNIYGLDFLAAGVLHKNISFLLIYTPRIDEPAADSRGYDSAGPVQLASMESANLVFSNLVQDILSVRVGRFEPAYHGISSKRSFYIMEPYEVYTFSTPSNNFVFDDNQMGIEAGGFSKTGFRYACGVVNGTGSSPDNNKFKDLYASVAQVIGRGEGQNAGQRIGVFGYYGWQPTTPGSYAAPTGETDGAGNKTFYRVGGNICLNYSTFSLQAFLMHGQDDKALNVLDSGRQDYKFTGGFARLDYSGLWNNRLLISGLFNWVQPPSYDSSRQIRAYSGLVRYYLGDWTAVNVALHAEYTHRETGKSEPFKEDQFTVLLDFDF